jgi:hypothetical protein
MWVTAFPSRRAMGIELGLFNENDGTGCGQARE